MNKEKATLEIDNAARLHGFDSFNLMGKLHTATPGESEESSRLKARELLIAKLGLEETERLLAIWAQFV